MDDMDISVYINLVFYLYKCWFPILNQLGDPEMRLASNDATDQQRPPDGLYRNDGLIDSYKASSRVRPVCDTGLHTY